MGEQGITISGGLDSINVDKDKDIQAAMSKADKALYKAKQSGRNMMLLGE